MFYIVGTGHVNLRGTSQVHITAPDPDIDNFPEAATYEGIAVFQSRTNTNEGAIIGNGSIELTGTSTATT